MDSRQPLAPNPIQTVNPPPETVREQDKMMLILSYLGVFALIPLLTVTDSEYVKWHAKNGLVISVGGALLVGVLGPLLYTVPLLGCLMTPSVFLAYLAILVVAVAKALQGVRWRVPLASDLAEKL